jgi:hypothetical protein
VARFVLIFGSEERERAIIKSKMQLFFQYGAEASSRSKRNKRGVARRGNLLPGDLLDKAKDITAQHHARLADIA